MQQEEDEILRKRAANETALMAIGSRKRKIDLQAAADAAQVESASFLHAFFSYTVAFVFFQSTVVWTDLTPTR